MDAIAVNAPLLDGEPFVGVARGACVESVHRVAACAVDRRGATCLSIGAIDVPVFLRSTAKPFIAAAAVREGVVERFGLEPREVAVMAASHNAESFHVEAVRSILRKIGLTETDLRCGPHPPYDPDAAAELERQGILPGAVHNNCSGKHAGILALCTVLGADPSTYLEPANLAQRRIIEFCARLCDQDVADLPLAIDGCGIPVFATPLRNAALAFSRLATLDCPDKRDAKALRIVRDAMIAHPQYVAGTGEFDTAVMQAANGRIAAKSGAEGVHGAAAIAAGIGVVLKVVDGAGRACAPAAIAVLHDLGLLDQPSVAKLAPFARPPVYNHAGRLVGSIFPLAARQGTDYGDTGTARSGT